MAINFRKFFKSLFELISKIFSKPKAPPSTGGEDVDPGPTIEYVELNICKVSGNVRGKYCKSTEIRTFEMGKEPKTICSVCKRIWPLKCAFPLHVFVAELLVANGKLRTFLELCRLAGVHGIRFFALQSWSRPKRIEPFLQAECNGVPVTYVQPDTKTVWPVFDMTQPNPAYWTRFREILALLKEYDLEAVVSIHDYCSFKGDKTEKFAYPFLCSLQTMSKDEDWAYIQPSAARKMMVQSNGGIYGDTPIPKAENSRLYWHKQWAKMIMVELEASGAAYRIEPVNEFGGLAWVDEGRPDVPISWYEKLTNALIGFGADKGKMIHSGWPEACLPMGGTYCLHNIVRPEDIPGGVKYMLSGDGGTQGRSLTDIDIKGRKGLSVEDGRKIARIIKARKMGGYDHMPKALNKLNDNLVNVDFMQYDILNAMTEESLK